MTRLEIVWEKNLFEIGIKVIDQQHKELVDYINKLAKAIDEKQSNKSISALFIELHAYIKLHFKAEEDYFFTLNKNDGLLHELQHKHFIEYLDRIIAAREYETNALELLYYLTDWLIHHIQVEDKKFLQQHAKQFIKPN